MKRRSRGLSNLYFRWGRAVGLDAEEVFSALEAAQLVERIGPDQYREIGPKQPLEAFEKAVSKALRKHLANQGGAQ